ncbi:MAG TPA: methylmalonyl-CoA epimerase [Candidatus Eremiobacteraceae bacterium]|nr:methylmalonyl-CoA epimerase [Candidatus Eremiobacteraceae bacterium]
MDHVALVVADLEEAEKLYALLGFDVRYRERVADQGVDIVGMSAGDATIELLKPIDPKSALERFRGDRRTRLHHVAYRVTDIEAELVRLAQAGIRLIDERPRRGAHGNLIAFIHPSSTGGTLVEVCQPPAT